MTFNPNFDYAIERDMAKSALAKAYSLATGIDRENIQVDLELGTIQGETVLRLIAMPRKGDSK
jgi:hypothetical protein